MREPMLPRLASLALAGLSLLSLQCGARSPLLESSSGSTALPSPVFLDGGTSSHPDASVDRCPAAVLALAGRPMVGHCSTRDGRSRVAGPTSPHLTWTARYGVGTLASDASGGVFLASDDGEDTTDGYSLTRVDAATGGMDWSIGAASGALSGPLLLDDRTMNVSVFSATGVSVLESLDPETGSEYPLPSTRQQGLEWGGVGPAVGTEGGLYFSVLEGGDLGIIRTAPDGAFYWKTGNLLSGADAGILRSSSVALAPGDVALIAGQAEGGNAMLFALDPATGDELWSFTAIGDFVGGPVVGPNGTALLLTGGSNEAASALTFVDTTGSAVATFDLSGVTVVTEILAIATDGTVLLRGRDSAENALLIAVSLAGHLAFQVPIPGLTQATIDARGVVFVTASAGVLGVDLATGATLWTLAAPGGAEVEDVVLTSDSGLVGIELDGTLFGASD